MESKVDHNICVNALYQTPFFKEFSNVKMSYIKVLEQAEI